MKYLRTISENKDYPGRLNRFYEEQMESEHNIFDLLFRHLDLWYGPYKVEVGDMKISIKIKKKRIRTGLMEILSQLEKDMKEIGYHGPEIYIDGSFIIINEI